MGKKTSSTQTALVGSTDSVNSKLYTLSRTERNGKVSFSLSCHRKGQLPHVRTMNNRALQHFISELKTDNQLKSEFESTKKKLDEGKGKVLSELQEIANTINTFQQG